MLRVLKIDVCRYDEPGRLSIFRFSAVLCEDRIQVTCICVDYNVIDLYVPVTSLCRSQNLIHAP